MTDLAFREHTWDKNIWTSVVQNNEYDLRGRFEAEDVILDIGAHIGSFAYVALDRGAGRVICVEPDAENFLYLRHNLHYACGATDRAVCLSAAAWRSDVLASVLRYAPVGSNTGGGNTLGDNGTPVAAFSLDALAYLAASAASNGRVRAIKLDCEGAEWPILFTAHVYAIVDAFLGEYHTLDPRQCYGMDATWDCTASGMRRFFTARGYEFAAVETGSGLGKFRAWKPRREV